MVVWSTRSTSNSTHSQQIRTCYDVERGVAFVFVLVLHGRIDAKWIGRWLSCATSPSMVENGCSALNAFENDLSHTREGANDSREIKVVNMHTAVCAVCSYCWPKGNYVFSHSRCQREFESEFVQQSQFRAYAKPHVSMKWFAIENECWCKTLSQLP